MEREHSSDSDLPFEIESAFRVGGDSVVIARALASQEFRLGPGATLGNCELVPVTQVPRALDPNGKQRTDLFAFLLRHEEDLAKFAGGGRVTLVAGERSRR